MVLHNEHYTVFSHVEVKPALDRFDIIHNTEKIDINDFYMAHIFEIERSDGHSVSVAMIDLLCSGYEPNAVLGKNYITLILFSAIIRIHPDTGAIVQYEPCENMGGLFEIHRIKDGYLIWGEGNIFCYDLSLKQIWDFSGRDILVSTHADIHFWIEDNIIHCRDFSGWHYLLDPDGKLIDNYLEFDG